ncbi:CFEM domain-containing protein [Zalerion maritima]|uniref:CFEM domain-containing protein n=1 Tax=Zalerion maritima TaxID=339359 RepID=A0AAD5WR69_9PEZI|nr:CFEM domain-containing protein [Zalerion maritima]
MQFTTVAVALFASVSFAQDLSGLPDCAVDCFTDNFDVSDCDSTEDFECLCLDSDYNNAVISCVIGACETLDQLTTLTWAQDTCESVGVELTLRNLSPRSRWRLSKLKSICPRALIYATSTPIPPPAPNMSPPIGQLINNAVDQLVEAPRHYLRSSGTCDDGFAALEAQLATLREKHAFLSTQADKIYWFSTVALVIMPFLPLLLSRFFASLVLVLITAVYWDVEELVVPVLAGLARLAKLGAGGKE